DESIARHGLCISRRVARYGVECRARLLEQVIGPGRELALAGSDPPVLHEGFVAIWTNLTDRRLEVDVGGRRPDPHVDGTASHDGGVRRQRCGDEGDGRAQGILLPVPLPLCGLPPQTSAAGVAAVVDG